MRELQPIVNRWFGRVPSAPRRKGVAKGTARPAGRTHPGVAAVPSASTRKEAVVPASACEAGQRQAVPWPTKWGDTGKAHDPSASAGAVGYPLGYPCGRAALHRLPRTLILPGQRTTASASAARYITVGVTACEQHIIRTVIISNIATELHHLRPDRDSNAGPTA